MDCKDCDYFEGFNREDGTPQCEMGYEECPYSEGEAKVEENAMGGFTLQVDTDVVGRYITSAIGDAILKRIDENIRGLVEKQFKESISKMTETAITNKIDAMVGEFMQGKIQLGNAWDSEREEVTREELLGRTISERLKKDFDTERKATEIVDARAKKQIDEWTDKLKRSVNSKVEQTFTEAARNALSENVVKILMANETYMRLQDTAKRIAGE